MIERLSIIWISDLSDKIKQDFFEAVVVSVLLYECTTWMLTKRMEKKLDGNYSQRLRAFLYKYQKQHSTKELYDQLPPKSQTIQVRQTKHAGHYWWSKYVHINDVHLWNPTHGHTTVGWLAKTYIKQLWADTRCSLPELSGVRDDMDG